MTGLGHALGYGKEKGWPSLVRAGLKKLRRFIYTREVFILNYIRLDSIPEVKPGTKVVVRDATWDDIPKMKNIRYSMGKFEDWLKRGCIFTIALKDDKVVSYLCMHTEPLPPFENVVNLKPDEIWGHYAYTVPEYRGNGIYPYIAYLAAKRLMKQGYKREYGIVRADNRTSIKVHDKMGKRDLQHVIHLKVFGIERCWNKPEKVAK